MLGGTLKKKGNCECTLFSTESLHKLAAPLNRIFKDDLSSISIRNTLHGLERRPVQYLYSILFSRTGKTTCSVILFDSLCTGWKDNLSSATIRFSVHGLESRPVQYPYSILCARTGKGRLHVLARGFIGRVPSRSLKQIQAIYLTDRAAYSILCTREYWMIYRGPGFLAVLWFGSSPTPFPPSPASKLDRRHIGRLRKRDKLRRGEGGVLGE
jgi:hypothetical protein